MQPEAGTKVQGRSVAYQKWEGLPGIVRHWLALANVASALVAGVPWLAPVLMKSGATRPAQAIYFGYSFLCHQLANRSFFLFGQKPTYAYTELLPFAADADTWSGLRSFVGLPNLGYKVAWSDRMVGMSIGIVLGGLVFALLRHRLRPLDWRAFGLLVLPMALDGLTHSISDLAGMGRGFRYTNAWLAGLTGNRMPSHFYVGNALGSFNSWMRVGTGVLFGFAVIWLVYPRLERSLRVSGDRAVGHRNVLRIGARAATEQS